MILHVYHSSVCREQFKSFHVIKSFKNVFDEGYHEQRGILHSQTPILFDFSSIEDDDDLFEHLHTAQSWSNSDNRLEAQTAALCSRKVHNTDRNLRSLNKIIWQF